MTDFYNHPPDTYYAIANQAAQQYTPELMPFHCDLVSRVRPGMNVLEFGCGTAHLCPGVENRGGAYTGMDHSAELLEENRRNFPSARFHAIGTETGEMFDLVASLYTIEHVTNPPAYLEQLWNFSKPGGLIAVICPELIDNNALAPSLYYGSTPRRFREKVRALDWADACSHVIDLKWRAARWKARARGAPPGAFWINTRPSELNGGIHGIDTDAIHLPRLADLKWWFLRRGAEIVTTSLEMKDVPPAVLAFNCYILVRKGS